MLKRLLLGLVIGLVVGALVAGVAIEGLGLMSFAGVGGVALAYILAAVTGVLVGLVAGKPIWAKGGQIEAGLKAFFGALLGAGLMFAMRSWLGLSIDLSSFHAATHPDVIGNLPAASLPLIAMVLGGFYELDNTPPPEEGEGKSAPKSSAKSKKNVRVAADESAADEEEEAAPSAKKMKR